MENADWSVKPVAVPGESAVAGWCDAPYLADAYAIRLPLDASTDTEQLSRFLFSHQPSWVARLMSVRDTVVARFGIKTAKQLRRSSGASGEGRVDIFKIYQRASHEIILGEDDKQLDFRVSVLRQMRNEAAGEYPYLVLSTVVHCHNRLGRVYITLIAPFHRMVVESTLRRAGRLGWPTAAKL